MNNEINKRDILEFTTIIVSAYFKNHTVEIEKIKNVVNRIYNEIESISRNPYLSGSATRLTPAVPIEESVHKDYIICLEDGKRLKMLKRYLRTIYGMTLEQYKERWELPYNYPTVCESYSQTRHNIAKHTKLGHNGNPKHRKKEKK